MRSFAMGRLPRMEGESREVRIWLARLSRDHQSVKYWSSACVDHWCTTGGYVGQRPGSKIAPGRGSSAICPSKLAFKIKVRTAECQGPQSCLPVRIGMSLVEGKEGLTGEVCKFKGFRTICGCWGKTGLAGNGMG